MSLPDSETLLLHKSHNLGLYASFYVHNSYFFYSYFFQKFFTVCITCVTDCLKLFSLTSEQGVENENPEWVRNPGEIIGYLEQRNCCSYSSALLKTL